MFKQFPLLQISLFILFYLFTSYSQTQEELIAMAQPGPEHQILEEFEGKWDVEFNYTPVPGGDTVKGNGTAINEMIIGGRFLQVDTKMEINDQPVNAMQIMGFDKRINKYTFFGIDEFGTYWVTAKGDLDVENNKIIMSGTDSLTVPGQNFNFKFIVYLPENDIYTVEVHYQDPSGNYQKMVEVINRRIDM